MRDDVPGQLRPQTGHVGQQFLAGLVQLDPDAVDATHDDVIEGLFQRGLIDIVLVLTHSDRFRVDLDQLCQGVDQSPPDRDRAAHRQVEVPELLARDLGGRVDRRAALVHPDHRDGTGEGDVAEELLGLAPGRAAADGHHLAFKPFRHVHGRPRRLGRLSLGAMGEHGVVMEELALLVQANRFATGAEPGIDRQHPLGTERRSQQKLPQVGRKHPNGLLVRTLLERDPHLGLERTAEQAAIGIVDGLAHLGRIFAAAVHEQRLQPRQGLRLRGHHRHVQDVLRFAAPHGENAMRGGRCRGLLPLEVVPELGPGGLRPGNHPAHDDGLAGEQVAQGSAPDRVLVDDLRDDVPGARERILHRGHAGLRVHEIRRGSGRIDPGLFEQHPRQGFEAFLARDHGSRPALGAIGQVKVLERGQRLGTIDPLLQLLGEVTVLFEGFQDGGPAGIELRQLVQPVAHGRHGDLVQAAGGFLAVAGDERDSGLRGQKGGHRRDLRLLQIELPGDDADMTGLHGSPSGCDGLEPGVECGARSGHRMAASG